MHSLSLVQTACFKSFCAVFKNHATNKSDIFQCLSKVSFGKCQMFLFVNDSLEPLKNLHTGGLDKGKAVRVGRFFAGKFPAKLTSPIFSDIIESGFFCLSRKEERI